MNLKKGILSILILFACGAMCSNVMANVSPEVNYQFDKTTMIRKKEQQAREQINNGNFEKARKIIAAIAKLSPNSYVIQELTELCDEGEARARQEMEDAYQSAISADSKYSLQEFISNYPQSEYVDDVKTRIEDYDLWENAKNTNTIDAYNKYINTSAACKYRDEAQKRIQNIKADQEWESCKNSNDETKLASFVKKYPSSKNIAEAKYKLNIIKGVNSFNRGDESTAYQCLSDASSYRALSGDAADVMKQINDKRAYETAVTSNDAQTVGNYLKSIPSSSKYYSSASNKYATLLANGLSYSSSELDYSTALSYATDDATRSQVNSRIDSAKKAKRHYNHIIWVENVKDWWRGRFTVGWNAVNLDYWPKTMDIGSGLRFRFGRFSDVLNLIFGGQFVFSSLLPEDLSDEDAKSTSLGCQVDIPVTLRLNTFKCGSKCKFYLGCSMVFGIRVGKGKDGIKINKNTMAVEPQLGWAGRHFDVGLYYRRYLKGHEFMDEDYIERQGLSDITNHRIGAFYTWYF